MRLELDTVVTTGNSLSMKREKVDDEKILRAHLAISGAFLTREQVDDLLQMPRDWFDDAFFDAGGAPRLRATLDVPRLRAKLAARFVDENGSAVLTLTDADLDSVTLTLDALGARLAGALSWTVRGDEAEDSERLVGTVLRLVGAVFNDKPDDLFAPARGQVRASETLF